MGLYPENSKEGFAILNRFGEVWRPVLYSTEEQAFKALRDEGFLESDIKQSFTIAKARFEILETKLEIV